MFIGLLQTLALDNSKRYVTVQNKHVAFLIIFYFLMQSQMCCVYKCNTTHILVVLSR